MIFNSVEMYFFCHVLSFLGLFIDLKRKQQRCGCVIVPKH